MTGRAARRILGLAAILAILAAGGWRARPWAWAEIRLRIAERALDAGRIDEAEARLDLLIAEDYRRTRPRLLRARAFRKRGRITEAEEALQRAVELGLPVEQGRREYALLRAGHDFRGAEASLRRILAARPDDEEVRRALADGRSRTGR